MTDYTRIARSLRGDSLATPVLFAGKNAKDADHAAFARAQDMERAGTDRSSIWDQTGWWNDNGHWNFEKSPSTPPGVDVSRIANPGQHADLNRIMNDPGFDASYPDLADMTVHNGSRRLNSDENAAVFPIPSAKAGGWMFLRPDGNDLAETVQHEKQHAIDMKEGVAEKWPRGGPWATQRVERRANNAGFRDMQMTAEERKFAPPWRTEEPAMIRNYSHVFPMDQLKDEAKMPGMAAAPPRR
jgi:hypothetical protein